MEKKEIVEDVAPTSKVQARKARGKPGKKSNQQRQNKFRENKNDAITSSFENGLRDRLLIEDSAPSSLESLLKARATGHGSVAVPLSITTRGVGFATALAFDRLVTTFEGKPPEVPLTIHQMYRVHLWAVHYKMYLAGRAMAEVPSYRVDPVDIAPSFEHVLMIIKVLPSVMAMILDCVGRVETPGGVYFGCYSRAPANEASLLEYQATTITPDNIRMMLTVAQTGTAIQRQRLQELWSIPGASFSEDGVLQNADDVYPEGYTSADLLTDVQTYMAFTIRIRKRFPPHVIRDIVWSSKASAGMLWSTPLLEVGLTSQFQVLEVADTSRKRKNQDGTYTTSTRRETRMIKYIRSHVPSDGLSRFTSYQKTDDLLSVIGCSSMIGEESGLLTRDYIGHPAYTDATPLATMRAMLYAS